MAIRNGKIYVNGNLIGTVKEYYDNKRIVVINNNSKRKN